MCVSQGDLSTEGDLETASLRVVPAAKSGKARLGSELDAAVEAMRTVPWTGLAELKGNSEILRKIDDAEALLKSLRQELSSQKKGE